MYKRQVWAGPAETTGSGDLADKCEEEGVGVGFGVALDFGFVLVELRIAGAQGVRRHEHEPVAVSYTHLDVYKRQCQE